MFLVNLWNISPLSIHYGKKKILNWNCQKNLQHSLLNHESISSWSLFLNTRTSSVLQLRKKSGSKKKNTVK